VLAIRPIEARLVETRRRLGDVKHAESVTPPRMGRKDRPGRARARRRDAGPLRRGICCRGFRGLSFLLSVGWVGVGHTQADRMRSKPHRTLRASSTAISLPITSIPTASCR
jgi:hypothetical protein